MPKTTRLEFEYPTEYQDPWFTIFERYVRSLDTTMYAHREDRNLIITGGGTVAWNSATELLTFTDDIVIISPITGYAMTLAATHSPITMLSGNMLYVNIPRGAVSPAVLEPLVGNTIPSSDNTVMIAVRSGTVIYFRNGRGFENGDSGFLYS
jgi:hypothetical protein